MMLKFRQLDRAVEECAELIKAISKARRFGLKNYHPDDFQCHSLPKEKWCDWRGPGDFMGHTCGKPRTNAEDILDEMKDVIQAINLATGTRARKETEGGEGNDVS